MIRIPNAARMIAAGLLVLAQLVARLRLDPPT
jgi:hypothetical protein